MSYVQKKILSLYVLTCRRPQRPTPRTCWNSRLVPWGKKCRDCKEDEFLERFLLVWDGFVWERFVLSERDWCCLREILAVCERFVSQKPELVWSDGGGSPKEHLVREAVFKLVHGNRHVPTICFKIRASHGEIELTFDSKKIPPWLFRAVVDVPIILRQQVDIMEDRTSPVTVGHRLLEARFKEQRGINFQTRFTNWSPWTQRLVTLPCWTSCCRPGSPHRSCSATAASWCVRSSWNHDFQQTAKLEPKI